MATFGRHMALLVWMLALLAIIVFVMTVRGPVRQAAWDEPCRTLRTGGSIPGNWNTIEPCRDVERAVGIRR